MRSPVQVFVIDGHDIEHYPDVASAAAEIEGYDAQDVVILGAEGTIYEAIVEGPESGPVSLRDSGRSDWAALVRLLRAEASARSVTLSPDLPDQPLAIWEAIMDAQVAQQRPRRPWWERDR